MMSIDGAKFEEHRFNTPRDMLDSVIYLFVERLMTSSLSSFAYYKNLNISITKEDIQKGKRHSSLFRKAFSLKISINYFLLHMHYKTRYKIHLKKGNQSSEFSFYCAIKIQRNVCSLNFTIA